MAPKQTGIQIARGSLRSRQFVRQVRIDDPETVAVMDTARDAALAAGQSQFMAAVAGDDARASHLQQRTQLAAGTVTMRGVAARPSRSPRPVYVAAVRGVAACPSRSPACMHMFVFVDGKTIND